MRPASAIQRFLRDWNQPSDLGLRMTKLGLLLLIATLIGNRILPKIEVEFERHTGCWAPRRVRDHPLAAVDCRDGAHSGRGGTYPHHRRALMWKTPYIAPRTSV